jgi:ABC-2 type transport system ATP-binding protein
MSDLRLEIVGLRAGYGRQVVLEDISLAVGAGEWFVLLGPNGCGKSTLLDCVVGRLQPASGEIRVAGRSLASDPLRAKQQLGYGCAPERLPGLLTARQCLEVHAGAKGLTAAAPDLLELAEDLRFLPYLDSFVDTLSLGTRQKLSVLLCLLGDPKLIVLDEAFNGLDPTSALVLKRHLHQRLERDGAALLLATHALDIVEHHADRTGLLFDGRLRREWRKAEIGALRQRGLGLDEAMAAALAEQSQSATRAGAA